eukprot:7578307-Alexandrium_andersonii.AAC.1
MTRSGQVRERAPPPPLRLPRAPTPPRWLPLPPGLDSRVPRLPPGLDPPVFSVPFGEREDFLPVPPGLDFDSFDPE